MKVLGEWIVHERFNREVWVFKDDFTGSLAKCLVKQSPYTVPNKLSTCISKFHKKLDSIATFDSAGMARVHLKALTERVNTILETIPEIMELNSPRIERCDTLFPDDSHPDTGFIDILAVAQNITCDFAERADAECWLDIPNE